MDEDIGYVVCRWPNLVADLVHSFLLQAAAGCHLLPVFLVFQVGMIAGNKNVKRPHA